MNQPRYEANGHYRFVERILFPLILALMLAGCMTPDSDSTSVSLECFDTQEKPNEAGWLLCLENSHALDDGRYHENWLLLSAPHFDGDLAINVAGQPVQAEWDGLQERCSRFSKEMEYVDTLQPIELLLDGEVVWSGAYGAGAGNPLYDETCPRTA